MAQQTAEIRLGDSRCLAWDQDYAFSDRANGYWCPVGAEPGVAWVYMLSQDVAKLPRNEPVALSITAGKSVTLPGLYFDTALVASGGAPETKSRAYAVRLVDARFMLGRMTTCNRSFNVRCPSPPSPSTDGSDPQEFYADTLNLLSPSSDEPEPWTWDQAAKAIWDELPIDLVNIWPGLPYQPNGLPENIRYIGVNAWHALHDLLAKINCTTAYDPQAATFRIARVGDTQPGLIAAQAAYTLVIDNADPMSNTATRLPESIKVYFHKQAQHFGAEPDSPRAKNWLEDGAVHEVEVPVGGAIEGTSVALFDDMPAMIDYHDQVINDAALNARATERAQRWYLEQLALLERSHVVYQGIAPEFAPGEQVTSVWWRDVGDGYLTEVTRAPEQPVAPWSHAAGRDVEKPSENFRPPDLARHTFPTYPRVSQLVKIVNPVKDDLGRMIGEVVAVDPGGNFVPDADDDERELCLIADLEAGADEQDQAPITHRVDQLVSARLVGVAPFNKTDALPLYVCDREPPIKQGTLVDDMEPGEEGKVATIDSDIVKGKDFWSSSKQKAGTKVFALFEAVQNSWSILTPGGKAPVLGKPEDDIANGKSGTVTVYSGTAGSEIEEEQNGLPVQIQAFNKFFGYALQDEWCFCEFNGEAWYITAATPSNIFWGVVQTQPVITGGSTITGYAPDQDAPVQLLDDVLGNRAGMPLIKARVRFAPVWDLEQVLVVWTGTRFVIAAGAYDGGILGTAPIDGIPKNGTAFCRVEIGNLAYTLQYLVSSPLGEIAAGKKIWISKNIDNLWATAAEC